MLKGVDLPPMIEKGILENQNGLSISSVICMSLIRTDESDNLVVECL